MCTWEECTVCWFWCHLASMFPYGFSVWMICPWWKCDIRGPTNNCVTVYFSFMFVSICLMYQGVLMWDVYIFMIAIFLNWILVHYVVSYFVSYNCLCLNVYFFWHEYCYASFFMISICMKYLLPFPYLQVVSVLRSEVGLL